MLKKISFIFGVVLAGLGIFGLKGPAVLPYEYLICFVLMAAGAAFMWLGNKSYFKKLKNKNENT